MYPSSQARNGYDAHPLRTERGTEYALFAKITARLKAVDEADLASFAALASAVSDNQHLWATLAEDLMGEANRLPVPLRAQLISLAEFVRKHSLAVLGGRATLGALIDINTAIMRGLRGNLEAAA
jgi:flagellar biosynthesis activator protein FlaF